jgi:hypothetical protein
MDFHKKLSGKEVVGALVGAALIAGLVSVISGGQESKAPVPQQESKKLDFGPSIGVPYSQSIKGFEQFGMTLNEAPLNTGERRMMGQTDQIKALVSLEVMGEPDSINRVTMMYGAVKDDVAINIGNVTCIALLFNNVMPEWPGSMKWANVAVNNLANGSKGEEIVQGNKRVRLTLIKELGMFFLTIEHKDRKEPA